MAATLDILDARWSKGRPSFSFEQWKALLHVATHLESEQLRQIAIANIESLELSPLSAVLLGRKYDVPMWMSTGCIGLCMRRKPITAEEGSHLGFELFADLVCIRESAKGRPCDRCRNWTISLTCTLCHESTKETVAAAVARLLSNPKLFRAGLSFISSSDIEERARESSVISGSSEGKVWTIRKKYRSK
ncbi:hypothetical protein FRC03_003743 [Tulasnella sp. 419]|nr:hypothetical protein FRC03_003743 [Tulasnella sp. 419]